MTYLEINNAMYRCRKEKGGGGRKEKERKEKQKTNTKRHFYDKRTKETPLIRNNLRLLISNNLMLPILRACRWRRACL